MNIGNYVQRFTDEVIFKRFRYNTQKNYINALAAFLLHFNNKVEKPQEINEAMIKEYLSRYTEHNTQRSNHSAIKCFYKYAMHQPDKFRFIEYCKRNRKLPIVLSQSEIQQLFNAVENTKHRAILAVMYACGLRVGEVVNLKISDIDSSRMVINIRDAKGGKDRQVMLTQKLLDQLRVYFKEFHPKEYLFNGQFELKYSTRSIEAFIKHYARKAGITKKVHPHLIRHCTGTHMVEAGTDINLIQKIFGHSSVKTTAIYTHISHNIISKIKSPFDEITA